MLDREGFRPNVGIILLNPKNQVFWGKRIRTHSWQFPQGGINYGETPEQAMFRELHEEVGLAPDHVRVVARRGDRVRLPAQPGLIFGVVRTYHARRPRDLARTDDAGSGAAAYGVSQSSNLKGDPPWRLPPIRR